MIELAQGARQIEIPLRREQLLHEAVGRHEEHRVAALDERVADGTQRVALADAGQAEGQHIGRLVEEVALRELLELADQRRRQAALRRAWRTSCRAAASRRGAGA